jgi:hypothetical protein
MAQVAREVLRVLDQRDQQRAHVDHQRACLDLRPHRRRIGATGAARGNNGQKGKARHDC